MLQIVADLLLLALLTLPVHEVEGVGAGAGLRVALLAAAHREAAVLAPALCGPDLILGHISTQGAYLLSTQGIYLLSTHGTYLLSTHGTLHLIYIMSKTYIEEKS